MSLGQRRILRARVVLPVSSPAIDNGAVLVSGNRIERLGAWTEFATESTETVDLGDSLLMPGLVNAHCHLDYTNMAGMVPAMKHFTDWIKSITTLKATWSYTEFADSWVHGAQMLLESGTTTVADIEAVPELLPDVWNATPLRVFSFLEMTGVRSRRDPNAILSDAVQTIDCLPPHRCQAGLSPHAPYSTTPALLKLSSDRARQRNWRMTTHVAESADEFDMFTKAQGGMHDWLARNERDMSDCGHGSPVQHLQRTGMLGERTLAVHANCLAPGDAKLLADSKTSVVHCPLSHQFFSHTRFSFEALRDAGVNICLGTDSLASAASKPGAHPSLDMFAEMHQFQLKHPEVSPETVIRMATQNGAKALGMAGQIGDLSPGSLADMIALPFSGGIDNAFEMLTSLAHGRVFFAMIDGKSPLVPDRVPQ